MKKSLLYLIPILILACIFVGCDQSSAHASSASPQASVDSFLQSIQKQDYSSSKTYYAENLDNMANFKNQIEDISPHVANELFNKMADFTYTINNSTIDRNNQQKAIVNVTINAYDLGKSFESTVLDYIKTDLEMTFDGAKSEDIVKETENVIVNEITNSNQTFSTTVDISLTKEKDAWKLDKISENPDLINALSGNIIFTIEKLSQTIQNMQ